MITNLSLYGTEGDVEYYGKALARLGIAQQEAEVLNKLISEYDFRVDVPVSINASTSGVHVCFNVPAELTDKDQHLLIADIVRAFGVKLERKFSEYSGKFTFTGTIKKLSNDMESYVSLYDAKANNCKIVAITEMKPVTRYVSDCSGDEAEKTQSVEVQ